MKTSTARAMVAYVKSIFLDISVITVMPSVLGKKFDDSMGPLLPNDFVYIYTDGVPL